VAVQVQHAARRVECHQQPPRPRQTARHRAVTIASLRQDTMTTEGKMGSINFINREEADCRAHAPLTILVKDLSTAT
jgi:hypothetical protein